jgi:hypothetical protein
VSGPVSEVPLGSPAVTSRSVKLSSSSTPALRPTRTVTQREDRIIVNLDAITSLIPQLEPARDKVITAYEKRFRDATTSLVAASALAADTAELICTINLKAARPRLTVEGFARVGGALDTARSIQRFLDTPGTGDVRAAIRAARAGRDNSEFDAGCRAVELTLGRYEGAVADLRTLVGRLSAQLDLIDPAAIYSDTFVVSEPTPGAPILMGR